MYSLRVSESWQEAIPWRSYEGEEGEPGGDGGKPRITYTKTRGETLIEEIRRVEKAVDVFRFKENWTIINESYGGREGVRLSEQGPRRGRVNSWFNQGCIRRAAFVNAGEIRDLF